MLSIVIFPNEYYVINSEMRPQSMVFHGSVKPIKGDASSRKKHKNAKPEGIVVFTYQVSVVEQTAKT